MDKSRDIKANSFGKKKKWVYLATIVGGFYYKRGY
jgi:hypothetical protein